MYVSQETPTQTDRRLRRVIADAELVWFDGAYAFDEYPVERFPGDAMANALAAVRDAHVWSLLVPSEQSEAERFALFSFHFPPNADNSGFVGWLASRFKEALGTGVFVVCGQNSRRGGIFDYWGVPLALRAQAEALLAHLRQGADGD